MKFTNEYPDYASVEEYIRRARLERSIAIGNLIADGVAATWRFMQKVADAIFSYRISVGSFLDHESAEHDRQAVEANPFLKRSVPHR